MRLIDADAFIAKLDHVPMIQDAIKKAMDTMPSAQPEIKTKQQEYVYIVFGDDVRSDGENIYGIHRLKKAAKDDMDFWKETRPDMIFHIEKHALDD